jgi:hypothetical protein
VASAHLSPDVNSEIPRTSSPVLVALQGYPLSCREPSPLLVPPSAERQRVSGDQRAGCRSCRSHRDATGLQSRTPGEQGESRLQNIIRNRTWAGSLSEADMKEAVSAPERSSKCSEAATDIVERFGDHRVASASDKDNIEARHVPCSFRGNHFYDSEGVLSPLSGQC